MSTKPEIIAIVLSKLQIEKGDVFVDVGCGTCSVSIHAAKFASKIYAIDDRKEAIEKCRQNFMINGIENFELIHSEASLAIPNLHNIDCAFVGGTRNLEKVLKVLSKKVRKRIVINAVRIETVARVISTMKSLGIFEEALLVQISKGYLLANETAFKPLNPVYIVVSSEPVSEQTLTLNP
ncbi:MAG: precorrin-6Y C5,15-methyltransferase (decarboxylating) subunit CbiT [Methanosarcinales archaeon]